MTPWQLAAMIAGHNRAAGGSAAPAAPSLDEHEARVARVMARQKTRLKPSETDHGAD